MSRVRIGLDEIKLLKVFRTTKNYSRFYILQELNFPKNHKLGYRLGKLAGMGLLERVGHGIYRQTEYGKNYFKEV